jgi:hypothetical protein
MVVFNGLITNDKFCMSRTARLQLSWWRLPRSARQISSEGVQSPVEENFREYLPQQENYEKTTNGTFGAATWSSLMLALDGTAAISL